MRFLKLKVENFAGLVAGQVEFGPGLNVLFGPNEMGKSTLAEAVRAVLLVQHTSSAHEPWVRWNSDEAPSVELVFQTDEQRYWRVRKCFGHTGKATATLDESRDATSFSNVAKGRRVDGELRKMLHWGIPEPGGGGGPRGLPETFLTSVLLPKQSDVTEVFRRQLSDDRDETGKQRLTEALQALATDPVFAKVLAAAQARVDEAFTSRGNKRTGQASPWRRVSDAIKRAEERVDQCRVELDKSNRVQQRIAELHTQLFEAIESRDQSRQKLELHRRFHQQRAEIAARRDGAQRERERIQRIHDDYDALRTRRNDLLEQVEQRAAERRSADEAAQASVRDLEAAQAAHRAATNEESAAQREIHRQSLENQLLQLKQDARVQQETIDQARSVETLTRQRASLEAEASEIRKAIDGCLSGAGRLNDQIELLKGLRLWQERQEAGEQWRSLEQVRAEVTGLGDKSEACERELAQLESELEPLCLPDSAELNRLKQLDHDLRVAAGKLEVGLSVRITPHQPITPQVSTDGGQVTEHALTETPAVFDARGQIEIKLPGVADLVVRGGADEMHAAAERLRATWQLEVQPALDAAGAADLAALQSLRQRADGLKERAAALRRDLAWNQQQIEAKGDVRAEAERLERRIAELDELLAAVDAEQLAERVTLLEGHSSAQRRQVIDDLLEETQKKLSEASAGGAAGRARLEGMQAEVNRMSAELEATAASLAQPWPTALADAEARRNAIEATRNRVAADLESLRSEVASPLVQAQSQLDSARQTLDAARASHQQITELHDSQLASLHVATGELQARTAEFEGADLAAATAAVEQVQCELDRLALPDGPDRHVTDETLVAEAEEVSRREAVVRELESQLTSEEGALKHVGGTAAREDYERFQEALRHEHDREAELALDYDAWRILLDALRDVENDDAAHLGQAVMEPIARRFAELTDGRYGRVQLGPALETQGIAVDGSTRDVGRLSVGTQEQLSTIMRIFLAEQLRSVVLLDDQLAQSDPQRMNWFCHVMRESARTTQIIVLTCRPEDYLLPAERVPGEAYVDANDGLIRAANLELLVSG